MRFLLVALALAACHRAPTAAAPTNKAPEPDYRSAAADELAFLANDADIVVGLDFVALRNSHMWSAFKPQLEAFTKKFQVLGGACASYDFTATLERMTMAVKLRGGDRFSGSIVMHGGDMNRALECSVAEIRKKGGTVTVDRGATVTTN